jgi:hypothetical protein
MCEPWDGLYWRKIYTKTCENWSIGSKVESWTQTHRQTAWPSDKPPSFLQATIRTWHENTDGKRNNCWNVSGKVYSDWGTQSSYMHLCETGAFDVFNVSISFWRTWQGSVQRHNKRCTANLTTKTKQKKITIADSALWHRVYWWAITNVPEEHTSSIFRV